MKIISHIRYDRGGLKKELIVVKSFDFLRVKELSSYKNAMVFTEEDFSGGIDVFPIDMFLMKQSYEVLEGKDIIRDLKINKKDLRHHLEYELRSNRIYLKTESLNIGAKKIVKNIYQVLYPNIVVAKELVDMDMKVFDRLKLHKEYSAEDLLKDADKLLTDIINQIN